MRVIGKEPEQNSQIKEIKNSLSALLIYNEEGRLQWLPYNLTFVGISFVRIIFFVEVAGDEFTNPSECQASIIMKWMEEKVPQCLL